MHVLQCNQPTYFDVDDTLVKWGVEPKPGEEAILVTCPTIKTVYDGEEVETTEWMERLVPHKVHIEALKLHKARGHTIIVWSAGGWHWAEAVVKALKLEEYVDLVIEKPMWAYDDLQPNEFIKRVYKEDHDGFNKP